MLPTLCYFEESSIDLLQGYLLVVHCYLHVCNSKRASSSIKTSASQPKPSRDHSYSPLSTPEYDVPLESYLKILL